MKSVKALFVSTMVFNSLLFGQNAVTNGLSGGRFGDNLISFLHAKWISYKFGVPFFYKSFPYVDQLMIDEKEVKIENCHQFFNGIKKFNINDLDKIVDPSHSDLYKIPYFPEENFGPYLDESEPLFAVDWKDEVFRELVNKLITPKNILSTVSLPKESVNVAIHVREGGGVDGKVVSLKFPTKFPPISFYKKGLAEVLQLFPNRSLYCYIFTDSKNPTEIARELENYIGKNKNIKFDWRRNENSHDTNVLEDFFSFFKFDVLIRPQSNFSFVPSLMHDFAVVFSPQSASIKKKSIVIDKCDLAINEDMYKKLLEDSSLIAEKD